MGNGGVEDYHHHSNKPTNNFLPMFCRLSLKDVKPTHNCKIPITPSAGDPGSPKVSCIGQVKRNSRVVGFPAAAPAPASHHKHRKPFSAKTLLPNTALGGSRSCRANIARSVRLIKDNYNTVNNCDSRDCGIYKVVDVGQMDPPLPVVKRVAAAAEVSLWNRRGKNSNGVEIGRLKIEEIKLQRNNGRFGFQTSPTTA